jgi:hypothetical protein
MPWLWSACSLTAAASTGRVSLDQPRPGSNLLPESNRASLQAAQR